MGVYLPKFVLNLVQFDNLLEWQYDRIKSDEMKLIDTKKEILEIYHKKKEEATKKSSCLEPTTLGNIIKSVRIEWTSDK